MHTRAGFAVSMLSVLLLGFAPPGHEAARVHFLGLLHDQRVVRGHEFDAGSLRDLLVVVEYRGFSGVHLQRIEFYAPDGSLYQRVGREVQLASGRTPAGRSNRVEVRFPVGGTWITQNSLLGTWRVEVYLDSETAPTTRDVFVLTH